MAILEFGLRHDDCLSRRKRKDLAGGGCKAEGGGVKGEGKDIRGKIVIVLNIFWGFEVN